MAKKFNPNEIIIEKVRAVEEYDLDTDIMTSRNTQIEEPTLHLGSTPQTVTDAMGATIATFYNAQVGTFSYTNSLLSLDTLASQFGAEKEVADGDNKLTVPVSETLTIDSEHKVTLKYVPAGLATAEISKVRILNEDNSFGELYTVGTEVKEGTFTIDAAQKTLTFPEGVTGRVLVDYETESANAIKISKTTEGVPAFKKLKIHIIFHDVCNTNIVYAGVIVANRAQHNPESMDIALKPDGKHSVTYNLNKQYCGENSKLVDIFVYGD